MQMKRVSGGFSPLIAVDRKAKEPLYKQIYDSYRALIVGQRLRPGQQIPSTRALASEMQISRIPVLTAYAQLLAEGYLEAREGAGTFVCNSLPDQITSSERATRSVVTRSGSRTIDRCANPATPVRGFPNRRIQPLCHLSAVCYLQFTTILRFACWPISLRSGQQSSVPCCNVSRLACILAIADSTAASKTLM